jgi:hypothetical protein
LSGAAALKGCIDRATPSLKVILIGVGSKRRILKMVYVQVEQSSAIAVARTKIVTVAKYKQSPFYLAASQRSGRYLNLPHISMLTWVGRSEPGLS